MSGELKEACGVFGIVGTPGAPHLAAEALFALQHRGQESAGIAAISNGQLLLEKGMGLVHEVFTEERLARLQGEMVIGHVRYSTTGASRPENAQPLYFRARLGPFALAHNGNLVDAMQERKALEAQGAIFQTTTDTEVVAHVMAHSSAQTLPQSLLDALGRLHGGYAIVVLFRGGVLGARDPYGIRPLVLGRLRGKPCLASETCALTAVGAVYERDVRPGEILWLTPQGDVMEIAAGDAKREKLCAFELIYFARPDSQVRGESIYGARYRLGQQLAKEAPAAADLVLGVPDSSLPAAEGYAAELGIPQELGLVKNRYVGRTFIRPGRDGRTAGVQRKLSVVPEVVRGRAVALIDDSLVRGTTMRHLTQILREAGATAVHVRIASPRYLHPCHYGIDTSNRDELIANESDPKILLQRIGADSLQFLSAEGVLRATGHQDHCLACFTGDYPVPVPLDLRKDSAEEEME
ncbi:MAG: amidophosphoribosyltransferase [Thermaerobacter sp.]|nr:amidophosphoribosyltransferase [Thermaerobacter sp.]